MAHKTFEDREARPESAGLSVESREAGSFLSPAGAAILQSRAVAALILVVGGAALYRFAFWSWYPHDDGVLAQAALRAVQGETPHVDFHDMYGGLLAYIHAGFFEIAGIGLDTLRISTLLIAAAAGWAIYSIMRRRHPPVLAAATAVVVWIVGFGIYPTPMPSWWNVSLALVAIALVGKWYDTGRSSFLALAGVATGVSFLVKSTGAYVAVAIGLILLGLMPPPAGKWTFRALGCASVVGFGLLLSGAPSLERFVVLLLPLALLVFAYGRTDGLNRDGPTEVDLRAFGIFLATTIFPIVLYIAVYVMQGEGQALLDGWWELPLRRFVEAEFPLRVWIVLTAGALGALGVAAWVYRRWGAMPAFALLAIGSIAVVAIDWRAWWVALIMLVRLTPIALAGQAVVQRRSSLEQSLIVMVLATFAFIQYPFGNPVYTLYIVPLAAPGLVMWLSRKIDLRFLTACLLGVALVVAVQIERDQQFITSAQTSSFEWVSLEGPRGGIRVPATQDYYIDLVNAMADLKGSVIYAGPDAPEIYFLTQTVNPTPVFFDHMSIDWGIDDLDDLIEGGHLDAVVVNNGLTFSRPLPESTVALIQEHFPSRRSFGKFDLYTTEGQ